MSHFVRHALAVACWVPVPVVVHAAAVVPGVRVLPTALPTGAPTQAPVGNIGGRPVYAPQVVKGQFETYRVNANANGSVTGTITQVDNAGILQWEKFDIGVNATLDVKQPSSNAVLLNKVSSGDFNKSTVIEGALNANGQVYVYNPNGIIFGKTSQVNVSSLVATTIKIDDGRFLAGLIAPNVNPIFASDSGVKPGAITVEGERNAAGAIEQAQINAARGGKILLIGSSVSNSGRLSAPDGQVLAAAASDKVYLAAPQNVLMRGLLVEVGSGGNVTNESLGRILVERGNASLVGAAVNQNGSISATTSVQANGSIYLHARDGAKKDANNVLGAAIASNGGALALGEGSVTEVLPDLADSTTAPKASFNPSQIDLAGQSVHLKQNAMVHAPGGQVTVSAQADPANRSTLGIVGGKIGERGVYVEAGATIDVSGTTHAELAMESNVIAVQLRGNELADVPLQRNSVLRGRTLFIDRRRGTPMANVQGYLDLREFGIGENTAAGGTVIFSADQEVVLAEGARVDVSGGTVNYRSGYVATTLLVSGRNTVDIGTASPDRIYTGLREPVAGPRNFEAGYSEGQNAGSVRFDAPALLLRGDLVGNVTPGPRQRDVAAANYPLGGEVVIGSALRIASSGLGNAQNFSFLGTVDFGGTSTATVATPAFGRAWNAADTGLQRLRSTVDIDPQLLAANGFTRINAYARNDERIAGDPWGKVAGTVVLSAPLNLKPGSEFRVAAQDSMSLNGSVYIPGGNVEAVASGLLTVAPGLIFDVAGSWTNDSSRVLPARDALGNLTTPIVTRGGSILLSGKGSGDTDNYGVRIGTGTLFDASGGAWQSATGKMTGGSGGAISIVSGAQDANSPLTAGLELGFGVDFRAYSLNTGGSVKLGGRNVVLLNDPTNPLLPYLSGLFYFLGGEGKSGNVALSAPKEAVDLAVSASWFRRGGFSKYEVSATGNLTVSEGTQIAPRMDNWIAARATTFTASGRMTDAFSVGTLPLGSALGTRGAASVSLAAAEKIVDGAGRLWLQKGVAIETDPGGSVSLTAGRQLTVDGRLTAPGGTVNLLLSPGFSDFASILYRPERSIWLGSTAIVDVSGSAAALWTKGGLSQGTVFDGGSIRIGRLDGNNLAPAVGYVVLEKGARLNVSGSSSDMSLSGAREGLYRRQVASAGGSIDIRAREGLLVEGDLAGAAGGSGAPGGSVSLTLDAEGIAGPVGSPGATRELVVLGQKLGNGTAGEFIVPPALKANQPFGADLAGKAYVLADALSNAGFDRISLKSQDKISFDASAGSVGVSARAEILLDAPIIAARSASAFSTVVLAAAHVAMGNSDYRYQSAGAAALPLAGDGANLIVNATTVDLFGRSVLQGFGSTNIFAQQEIRFSGVVAEDLSLAAPVALPAIHAIGSFQVAGSLNLTAAQVYPTTMSEFSLGATGTGSRIEFQGNGTRMNAPLSAAGTLAVGADNIVQNGVLLAPFGSIALTAKEKLVFGADSLTSVAGSGNVPLGRVSNGRDWLYDFGNGHTVSLGNPSASNGVALPNKKITSTAPNIEVASGAVIDLSGGGDLYAYEFTAGPGGSRDVLAKPASAAAAATFAVRPGYDASFAPIDFQYQQDGGLRAGDRIYLSGIPGLAPGFYTLLPAHYALLPGAFAVTAASGTRDMVATSNTRKADGSWLAAGYRGSVVASDSRWSGYVVMASDQVRTQSQFSDYSANAFLSPANATLPSGGGQVVFAASASLALDGQVNLAAAPGGRRGIADISAPEIEVVADNAQTAGSAVKLLAANLTALGADSLLLGGVREFQGDATQLHVTANRVTVSNDAQHPLSGPEILLAARDRVRIAAGGSISSSGTPDAFRGDVQVAGTGAAADGALLRVSGGAQATVVRNTPAAASGTLSVESGAVIRAMGSMNLDATGSFNNQSIPALGEQTAVSFGANRVSLGDAVPASAGGLRLDNTVLTALNGVSDLSLTSYTTFDVYGAAALGSAATRSLRLRGAGIQAYGAADAPLSLTADTIRFDGGGTFTPAANTGVASGVAGNLAASARDIEIGNGSFAVKGYRQVGLSAQREIRAVGKGASLSTESEMTLASGAVTVTSGADATVRAGGRLTLTGVTNPQAAVTVGGLGGNLTFVGDSIVSDAAIIAKAGQITLRAQGANGVQVTAGLLDASGEARSFGNTVAFAPGGRIELDGGSGSVTLGASASLDVSASGAAAGVLSIKAPKGGAIVESVLSGGSAEPGQTQGEFVLDTGSSGSAAQFASLNARLNTSGFTEARSVRVRNGDIVVSDAGNDGGGNRIDAILARRVLLSTDNGDLTVDGVINAQGAKGGTIALYAGQAGAVGHSGNVTLLGNAALLANATAAAISGAGATGDGGSVVIGTAAVDGQTPTAGSGSRIAMQTGSRIDVSARGLGESGKVTLRAPRLGAEGGNDVAVSRLEANIVGSGVTTVEAYKVYNGTSIGTDADSTSNLRVADASGAPAGLMYEQAQSFMSNASGILGRLGVPASGVVINPGVEIRSSADLTVSVNETVANAQNRGWNLNAWRFGPNADQPGVLTLRAANNLTINGSISDGFVRPAARIAMPGWTLDPGGNASWSYRLVGGADLAAANPLNVLDGRTVAGDVSLKFARSNTLNDQPVALIRTGSGDINIAAGRDVVFGSTKILIPVPFPDSAGQSVQDVLGATVYTAGRSKPLESGFLAPNNQIIYSIYANGLSASTAASKTTAGFATGGGSITIGAGRDVNGIATRQLVNNWLFRRGAVTTDVNGNTIFAAADPLDGTLPNTRFEAILSTGWWPRYDFFNQGVATFGGGDIAVNAGRNVNNLSLSAATSGQVPGGGAQQNLPTALVERGGGDIRLQAGGDIRGGTYYVQKGNATLRAGGSVLAGDSTISDGQLGQVTLRPVLALGDARIDITAAGNVEIETAFNPTLERQTTYNADGQFSSLRRRSPLSVFSTYSADSGLTLTSLTGDVLLGNHSGALGTAAVPWTITSPNGINTYLVYPASLRSAALSGKVIFENGFSLWPSAEGQLELLAADSVAAAYPRLQGSGLNVVDAQPIVMIDAAPSTLANILAPLRDAAGIANLLKPTGDVSGLAAHTEGGLHANDKRPVRIVALSGDILGESFFGGSFFHNTLVASKPVDLIAGKDIRDFGFSVQHLRENDVSSVVAGRDFVDTTYPDLSPVQHYVSGPGRLDVTAGRNIDLGTSGGIVTRGNLDNPFLPSGGASISLVAGPAPDYAGFVSRYVTAADVSASDGAALVAYLRERNPALPAVMRIKDALALFNALPITKREGFLSTWKTSLNDVFFEKLRVASGAVGGGALDLVAFDALIESLFPAAGKATGDINVFGSQLKTARGGSISVFAPGGSVQAGLAEKPAWVRQRLLGDKSFESNLGIYTIAGGNLQSLVRNDFLVNQGRVFTLGGGDITLVSQFGNIDAGKGAKTAQSTPAPVIRTDAQGNTVVDISGSISGSGIATLRTGPSVPASSVYPIAPRGIFDAGDAGVRSTGSVGIVAQTVLNANNIAASGTVSGAKTVDSSGLGSVAAAPASATPAPKTDTFAKPPASDANAAANLTVELLGYGAADGQQSVIQDSQNTTPAVRKPAVPDEQDRK